MSTPIRFQPCLISRLALLLLEARQRGEGFPLRFAAGWLIVGSMVGCPKGRHVPLSRRLPTPIRARWVIERQSSERCQLLPKVQSVSAAPLPNILRNERLA
jgi:hypothetical protein